MGRRRCLGVAWKLFRALLEAIWGLGGTSKASEGSIGQLLGSLGGPEYAKPGPEYAKPPPWAPLGGSLGQSREDVGHILGSFGEPSGVKKGRGKRLRSISIEC